MRKELSASFEEAKTTMLKLERQLKLQQQLEQTNCWSMWGVWTYLPDRRLLSIGWTFPPDYEESDVDTVYARVVRELLHKFVDDHSSTYFRPDFMEQLKKLAGKGVNALLAYGNRTSDVNIGWVSACVEARALAWFPQTRLHMQLDLSHALGGYWFDLRHPAAVAEARELCS